jgi:ABC-type histidine transport system ATPase subunit
MLNVSNLFAGYGQSVALHGITFSAKKNETIAIMGRSKHTSSQESAALGKNLAYSWRGIKKT